MSACYLSAWEAFDRDFLTPSASGKLFDLLGRLFGNSAFGLAVGLTLGAGVSYWVSSVLDDRKRTADDRHALHGAYRSFLASMSELSIAATNEKNPERFNAYVSKAAASMDDLMLLTPKNTMAPAAELRRIARNLRHAHYDLDEKDPDREQKKKDARADWEKRHAEMLNAIRMELIGVGLPEGYRESEANKQGNSETSQ